MICINFAVIVLGAIGVGTVVWTKSSETISVAGINEYSLYHSSDAPSRGIDYASVGHFANDEGGNSSVFSRFVYFFGQNTNLTRYGLPSAEHTSANIRNRPLKGVRSITQTLVSTLKARLHFLSREIAAIGNDDGNTIDSTGTTSFILGQPNVSEIYRGPVDSFHDLGLGLEDFIGAIRNISLLFGNSEKSNCDADNNNRSNRLYPTRKVPKKILSSEIFVIRCIFVFGAFSNLVAPLGKT